MGKQMKKIVEQVEGEGFRTAAPTADDAWEKWCPQYRELLERAGYRAVRVEIREVGDE